jgi:predicted negative regulator of RcsB-dependent stress response
MKAAKILASCTYSPETLKIISKAFDDAWADIAEHFAGDAGRAAAARERLAHAVLIAATNVSHESGQIKGMALQIMALSYRGSWLDPSCKFPDREASPTAVLH